MANNKDMNINKNTVVTKVNGGFLDAPILNDEYMRGSSRSLGGSMDRAVLMPSGDWSQLAYDWQELQSPYFETMACVTFGTLHALEMLHHQRTISASLLTEKKIGSAGDPAGSSGEPLNRAGGQLAANAALRRNSDRFIATLSGTTANGNTPQKVCETIRKKGLLSEAHLPVTPEINTWNKFYTGVTDRLKGEALRYLDSYKMGHEWVFQNGVPTDVQKQLIAEALKHSPVGVSVYAWAEHAVSEGDSRGSEDPLHTTSKRGSVYVSPKGVNQNHWCLVVRVNDDGSYVVLDQYEPFIKTLHEDFRFGVAKSWEIERKVNLSLWDRFKTILMNAFRLS